MPQSYKTFLNINDTYDDKTMIHAGIIGFSKHPQLTRIFEKIYAAAVAGLALGFSPNDQWRNKGKDKNTFTRDCRLFRHDLTLLNIFLRLHWKNIIIQPVENYHGGLLNSTNQRVWHIRLNWKRLQYLSANKLHKRNNFYIVTNRFIIEIILAIRRLVHFAKGIKTNNY